jgi:hypothetical protein
MNAVERNQGLITRRDALSVVRHDVLDKAVSGGALVRVFPEVFALTDSSMLPDIRRRAALMYQPDSALSHVDALELWNLPCERAELVEPAVVHITKGDLASTIDVAGLVVHRRRGFELGPPTTVVRDDRAVVRLEQCIVESWPLLTNLSRCAPAIIAVRDRRTTGQRLLECLDRNGRTTGAAAMRRLFGALEEGCHSELELWGHQSVFTHPSLPSSRGQVPVRLGTRTIYLDRAFDAEMVDVELDGAAYHGAPHQRERDLRRDAALARLGWLTVRFSHPRLYADPDDVRAELRDILTTRRRQLRIQSA